MPASQLMAILSLIFGIVGLVLSFIPCVCIASVFLTTPGIVLGVIALVKAIKNHAPGKGCAIAGLACSVVGSLVFLIWCIVFQAGAEAMSAASSRDYDNFTKKVDKDIDEFFDELGSSTEWGKVNKALNKEFEEERKELEALERKATSEMEEMDREWEKAKRELEKANKDFERELRNLDLD